MNPTCKITLIAAINNNSVAEQNLFRSPLLQTNIVQFIPVEGSATAAQAYNHGITKATGDILVFAHQDVYIPSTWHQHLLNAITLLENRSPSWGVLGSVGVDNYNSVQGVSWSTGLNREVATPVKRPEPAVSLDELILVVRKSSGLVFDDNLPGWHLYGTDIVQEAQKRGLGSYIIHAPVIHNSLPVVRFDAGFAKCYQYLQRKWACSLPIQTCCIRLTRFGWPFLKRRIRQLGVIADRRVFIRLPDAPAKAKELKYE